MRFLHISKYLYCSKFHALQTTYIIEYCASDHEDGIRGRIRHTELCMEFLQALHEQGDSNSSTGTTFPVFSKYKLNGVFYQT